MLILRDRSHLLNGFAEGRVFICSAFFLRSLGLTYFDKDLIVLRDDPEEQPCGLPSHSEDSLGKLYLGYLIAYGY